MGVAGLSGGEGRRERARGESGAGKERTTTNIPAVMIILERGIVKACGMQKIRNWRAGTANTAHAREETIEGAVEETMINIRDDPRGVEALHGITGLVDREETVDRHALLLLKTDVERSIVTTP